MNNTVFVNGCSSDQRKTHNSNLTTTYLSIFFKSSLLDYHEEILEAQRGTCRVQVWHLLMLFVCEYCSPCHVVVLLRSRERLSTVTRGLRLDTMWSSLHFYFFYIFIYNYDSSVFISGDLFDNFYVEPFVHFWDLFVVVRLMVRRTGWGRLHLPTGDRTSGEVALQHAQAASYRIKCNSGYRYLI